MPPKVIFTKNDVVAQALQVVREEGLNSLSARKIAQKMGSSTAPVYQWFNSMDELLEPVMVKIKSIAMEYMAKKYTGRHFLNIGMGFAIFARDERELFKAFHLENKTHRHLIDEMFVELREDMLRDPRFAEMPAQDRGKLLDKMWTFTFGLSTQICFKTIQNPSNDFIQRTLIETGTIIITDVLKNLEDKDEC